MAVPTRPRIAVPALRLAQRVWHPACGRLTLSSDPVPAELVADGIGVISGWAWAGDCTIHLHRHLRWLGGPDLCETILHEAGHVAGFHETGGPDDGAHSANPNSIMYPQQFVMKVRGNVIDRHGHHHRTVRWGGVDRRCLRAYHARGGA